MGTGTFNDGTESRTFNNTSTTGTYSHKLTIEQIPNHTHTYIKSNYIEERIYGYNDGYRWISSTNQVEPTSSMSNRVGDDNPHNNIQPSYAVYIYRRTG